MAAWGRHTDPLLAQYNVPERTPAEWDEWFRARVLPEDVYAFVIDDKQGRMVGWLVLSEVRPDEGRATLGIDLSPERLYQGLGSDAIHTILREFLGPWGFRTMWLEVSAPNRAARRCYEKCGFTVVGRKWRGDAPLTYAEIFGDERFEDIRRYFRILNGTIEVMYYDMKVTVNAWRAHCERRDF
jgi:RimJ/RimL family protein N-acetyltransferase